MSKLVELLINLGFTINWKKLEPPTQKITFFGQIDSNRQTLCVPSNKLQEIKEEVKYWLNKKSYTKRQLQRIIGQLNWIANLIRAARPLLRKLIDKWQKLDRPSHSTRITKDMLDELNKWSKFLQSDSINGVAYYLRYKSQPNIILSTDACSEGGAAWHSNAKASAAFSNDWFYTNWKADYPGIVDYDINIKELYIIVLAVRRWSSYWYDKRIVVYTDNNCALYWLNKLSARNEVALEWLKELAWLSTVKNFYITARRITSKNNVTADALSRMNNLDHAALAHAMLQQFCGIDIADSEYDLFKHMSYNSFITVLQDWGLISGAC